MPEIELATSQELIDELMRRPNFIGVLIYSDQSDRPGAKHSMRVASTIVPDETAMILEATLGAYHNPPVGSSDDEAEIH